MEKYLQSSEIIDWQNPEILELAHRLASTCQTTEEVAKACFEWVRDEIHHSYDYQMNPVTCRASDVLKYKTGYCFAKSHLVDGSEIVNRTGETSSFNMIYHFP